MILSRSHINLWGGLMTLAATAVLNKIGWPPSVPSVPALPAVSIPIVRSDGDRSPMEPQVESAIALVYGLDSQTLFFERRADQPWPPASTTKLMTALVARDFYTLDTLLTVDREDVVRAERPLFQPGEELTVEDLLEALLVSSANQAAYILANHHPAGQTGFVQAMNVKAESLNLTATHFTDPAGFDHADQYMTAFDLVTLGQTVMADAVLERMVSLKQTAVADFNGDGTHQIESTNRLLGGEYEVVGIKTGTTQAAGQVLISQFRLPAEDVVIVVMGSADRYSDTKQLIDWVTNRHSWLTAAELAALVGSSI